MTLTTDGATDGTTDRTVGAAPTILGIYRRVLEAETVDDDTDFFQAGGDSLLATRVLSAIARDLGVELTFDDFVIAPTPGALSALVEGRQS